MKSDLVIAFSESREEAIARIEESHGGREYTTLSSGFRTGASFEDTAARKPAFTIKKSEDKALYCLIVRFDYE